MNLALRVLSLLLTVERPYVVEENQLEWKVNKSFSLAGYLDIASRPVQRITTSRSCSRIASLFVFSRLVPGTQHCPWLPISNIANWGVGWNYSGCIALYRHPRFLMRFLDSLIQRRSGRGSAHTLEICERDLEHRVVVNREVGDRSHIEPSSLRSGSDTAAGAGLAHVLVERLCCQWQTDIFVHERDAVARNPAQL